MLKATTELERCLGENLKHVPSGLSDALLRVILAHGTGTDAARLFKLYLTSADEHFRSRAVLVIGAIGDSTLAERLAAKTLAAGEIMHGTPPEALEALGQLRYTPAKEILAEYAFSTEVNHDLQRAATLGLLHFDLREYEMRIASALQAILNKNLFPEFLPALVSKLPDREDWPQKLYEWGDQYASTDCNAGIILGLSRCGGAGKPYFERAIFNPNWELYRTSGGSSRYVYTGLRNLQISFACLYKKVQSFSEPKAQQYGLWVLLALLRHRLEDYNARPYESLAALYQNVFIPSREPALADFAGQHGCAEEAAHLQELFEVRLKTEIISCNGSSHA